MLTWFHKQFIPHEGNDHKPHFLRLKNAARVLAFVVFVEIVLLSQVYVFPQFKDFLAAVLPGVLVDLANGSRDNISEGKLIVNPLLVVSAQMKAEHMAKFGYFAHDSPTGESPWVWFGKAGYKFFYAGENLAVHFIDSEDVHRAWMASETHRANILNSNFTEIGIGIAQGVFRGRNALFIVQHFGKPMFVPSEPTGPLALAGPVSDAAPPVETPKPVEHTSENISGEFAGSITIPKVNLISKIFSMPNNVTAGIYLFTLLIVTVALILKIFIKIRIQHPRLILTGFALIFTISGLIAANYYLLTLPGQI
ncbi:MAG: CAP domain-containing protein [Patescibacteria group bacterium]